MYMLSTHPQCKILTSKPPWSQINARRPQIDEEDEMLSATPTFSDSKCLWLNAKLSLSGWFYSKELPPTSHLNSLKSKRKDWSPKERERRRNKWWELTVLGQERRDRGRYNKWYSRLLGLVWQTQLIKLVMGQVISPFPHTSPLASPHS